MFYPGDPIDEKKRQLIARLSGARRGSGGFSGQRVGRVPGFFGRGVHPGGGFGGEVPPGLMNNPHFQGFAPPALQGNGAGMNFQAEAPQFSFTGPQYPGGSDIVHMGPQPRWEGTLNPSMLPGGQDVHPAFNGLNLQQILGNYGRTSGGGMFRAI